MGALLNATNGGSPDIWAFILKINLLKNGFKPNKQPLVGCLLWFVF
jgi:hypothetical protein